MKHQEVILNGAANGTAPSDVTLTSSATVNRGLLPLREGKGMTLFMEKNLLRTLKGLDSCKDLVPFSDSDYHAFLELSRLAEHKTRLINQGAFKTYIERFQLASTSKPYFVPLHFTFSTDITVGLLVTIISSIVEDFGFNPEFVDDVDKIVTDVVKELLLGENGDDLLKRPTLNGGIRDLVIISPLAFSEISVSVVKHLTLLFNSYAQTDEDLTLRGLDPIEGVNAFTSAVPAEYYFYYFMFKISKV